MQVLDLAKIEADELTLERKEFKLATVVDDVRLFSILATKNRVEFIEDLGEWYDGPLFGDLLRLRQSVSNGISNAIKFSVSYILIRLATPFADIPRHLAEGGLGRLPRSTRVRDGRSSDHLLRHRGYRVRNRPCRASQPLSTFPVSSESG